MRWIQSFWVALSTYSVIPVPQFTWDRNNMRYALCFLPFVGIFCGGALLFWTWLCLALDISGILFAAVAACLPLFITGGIHMDGFMDTVDALCSHQPRERKLEILKDPHCGAFSILYCGAYLLLQFALLFALYEAGHITVCCPIFILSRSLSALCALSMPNARGDGMLSAFTKDAKQTAAMSALAAVSLLAGGAMLLLSPLPGMGGILLGLGTLAYYRRMADKQFGGATGDTAGFFLQLCELSMLAGIWIGGMIG